MIILEGSTTQRTGCSIEQLHDEPGYTINSHGSQAWVRITERAVRKGAGKRMVRWLDRIGAESANKAAHGLEQAGMAANPLLQSASRAFLQTAGTRLRLLR